MRFLFAVTLTSLVPFESIEVATPGHMTSAQGVRSSRERGRTARRRASGGTP